MAYIGNTVENQGFTPAIDYFNGDGVTVTFTLSRPIASVAQVIVAIDNVIQNPSSSYTVAGSAITFSSAPLSGTNNIWVEYTSLITTYNAISQDPTVIGDIRATGGYLAEGDFGNSFVDGVIVDYVTGLGRVTVGTAEGIALYNGGTASRTALLSIGTTGQTTINSSSSASAVILNSTNAGGTALNIQNSGTVNSLLGGYNSIVGSGNATDVMLSATQGALAFGTGASSTERMRITSAGNVGIGTTSPAAVTGFSTGRTVLQVTPSGGGSAQLRLGAASGTMIDHDDGGNTITTIRNLYGATSATAQMQLQSGFITLNTGTSYTEQMRLNAAGLLQFNSGYGSVATAYGCRAWISFNGSSGAINGSGNISSVSNNATGDWTINFSTSMPDGNYSIVGMVRSDNDSNPAANPAMRSSDSPAAGSCRVFFGVSNSRIAFTLAMFAVFR